MKHFNNAKDLTELRNQYRDLAKKFHPDVSGYDSKITMQEINNEFEQLGKLLAKGLKYEQSEIDYNTLYVDILSQIIHFQNVVIEIIGNWLWVSGDTKPVKEQVKNLGFVFAPKKVAWYYKNYTYRKQSKKSFELDELKDLYGSTKIKTKQLNYIGV